MANLVLKNVRCVYPVLREAKAFTANGVESGEKAKSISVLIPKTDTTMVKQIVDYYTKAVNDSTLKTPAMKAEVLKVANNNQDATNKYCILKDGDVKNKYRVEMQEKDALAYQHGHYVLSAKMPESWNREIFVVDRQAQPIPVSQIDATILSGYWVHVAVFASVYNNQYGAGVSLKLVGVQLVRKDEVIGLENPFEALEGEEPDEETNEGNPFPE